MDPKVCGKLLTTHRKGYGVDVEALNGGIPLRQNTAPWMFLGYVGLYRRKKYVGGRPRGPRDRGRAL